MKDSDKVRELRKQIVKAGIIFGILFVAIGWIHESGHALICFSKHGSFLWSDFFNFNVKCFTIPDDSKTIYWAMGGIFGTIVSSLFLIPKKLREDIFILVSVLPIIVKNFIEFIFETFWHDQYLHNIPFKEILSALTIILFLILLFCSSIVAKKKC